MKEEARKLLDKADQAIKAAETLLKAGSVDFAAGRAYITRVDVEEIIEHAKEFLTTANLFGEFKSMRNSNDKSTD